MRHRLRNVLVLVPVLFAVMVAEASAVVQATGALTRNADGTTLTLIVTNNSTAGETIDSVEFRLAGGYTITNASGPGGACGGGGSDPSYTLCGFLAIPPGSSGTFTLTPNPAPYPDGAGGDLGVYTGVPLSGPFAITGPSTAPVVPPVVPPVTPPGQTGPVPVQDKSEVVEPVSGTVLIRRPGEKNFTRVPAAQLIPDGSELDTRKGTARIKVAADRTGTVFQTAEVSRGLVVVDQMGKLTQLRLSEKLKCREERRGRSRKSKKPPRRQVFVKSKDNFQTRGNHAAGTVRGTEWLTTDYCDRTVIKVVQSVVSVRDFVKKKTVLVTAPDSYTARAPSP